MFYLFFSLFIALTDYIPQKQGLRLNSFLEFPCIHNTHRLYSTKTRIKTLVRYLNSISFDSLTDYIPQKQGLRPLHTLCMLPSPRPHRLYSTKTRIKTQSQLLLVAKSHLAHRLYSTKTRIKTGVSTFKLLN